MILARLRSSPLGRAAGRTPTWAWVLAAGIGGCALLVTRQPHILINPQLWAEDGKVWYRDAYLHGPIRPLLWPYAGYLNTCQRLVGGLGLVVPIAVLPLFFACADLVMQVLPVMFLATDRMCTVTSSRTIRVGIGLAGLALPDLAELTGNVTNTQWSLAVLAALVLVARPAGSKAWRVFDVAVILIGGLSGPFSFFLAPEAMALAAIRRSRLQFTLAMLVCATAATQATALSLSAASQRPLLLGPFHLEATAGAALVAGRMLLAPLAGASRGTAFAVAIGPWGDLAVSAIATSLIATAMLQSSTELRLLLCFGLLTLAGTLAGTRGLWIDMVRPAAAERYWYIPMLTWIVALAVVAARHRRRWVRASALYALLAVALVGIPSGWQYPAPANAHFQEAASKFATAPPGRAVTFQEDPPGWRFVLVKVRPTI